MLVQTIYNLDQVVSIDLCNVCVNTVNGEGECQKRLLKPEVILTFSNGNNYHRDFETFGLSRDFYNSIQNRIPNIHITI